MVSAATGKRVGDNVAKHGNGEPIHPAVCLVEPLSGLSDEDY
jgi:hypothetical protein